MKKVLPILLLAIVLISCKKDSSKVNQNEIFQSYIATYDANLDKTTFVAKFYEGNSSGKNLVLSDNSSITLNGNKMSRSGSTYTFSSTGQIATGTFVFTDEDGNVFTNLASPPAFIGNELDDWINNSYTNYWNWQGNSIGMNEEVNLRFINTDDASETLTYIENGIGETDVTMTANSMNGFPVGEARAEINREENLTTGDFNIVGGQITCVYQGLEIYVQFY